MVDELFRDAHQSSSIAKTRTTDALDALAVAIHDLKCQMELVITRGKAATEYYAL